MYVIIGVIWLGLSLHRGPGGYIGLDLIIIGVISGLYWYNGKENGNDYLGFGVI